MFKQLFSPVRIGSMELKNRIVMAPMTIDSANPDESPSDRQIAYYAERAKGGAGLITVEVATIDGGHRYQQHSLGIYSDALIPGHKKLVDAIHQHGTKAVLQIVHTGPESLAPFYTGQQPIGPSVVRTPTTRQVCREATLEEIATVIEQFGDAAVRARAAGYDGIELHSAHSYLFLGSFLSTLRNLRQDAYAGHTFEGRTRLLLQVVECIRQKAGNDFPITVRLSGFERESGAREINDTQRLAPLLEAAGVSCLHISGGVSDANITQIITGPEYRQGYNLAAAEAVRKVVSIPVMVVGQNNDLAECEYMLESGQADLIAIGRGLLADPELPNKAKVGKLDAITPCNLCQGCVDVMMTEGAGVRCYVNPRCCREGEIPPLQKSASPKKVLVIGGGPAGIAAATHATACGHTVTLVESAEELGGAFLVASETFPHNRKLLDHLVSQLRDSSALVVTGVVATAETVKKQQPDVVILATGGKFEIPAIEGVNLPLVISGESIRQIPVLVKESESIGRKVVVIGASLIGLEIAEYLASHGRKVHLLDPTQRYGAPAGKKRRTDHAKRLDLFGVPLNTGVTIRAITPDGVKIVTAQGREVLVAADSVVVVGQVVAQNALVEELKTMVKEVHLIGDAAGFGLSRKALDDALRVAGGLST
jgi:2,4-dienoyl-CoA reductase (NADPH2)